MYNLFLKLCDSIFPPSETLLHVREISPEMMHLKYCLTIHDDFRALSAYADTDIRALIHEAKFHGNTNAFQLLNTLFAHYLSDVPKVYDVIIPIPLPPSRMRTRGYNQVHEILRAGTIAIPINTIVLKRTRNTRPQTELKKKERLDNLHDAFSIMDTTFIKGKHVLLVDDVSTTGTTLHEAKATLLPHGPASVTCLAIAH